MQPEGYRPVEEAEEPSLRKSAIPLVVTKRAEVSMSDRRSCEFPEPCRYQSPTTMGAGESKQSEPQQALDYYELLQVDENVTAEEIKVSF